MITSLFNIGEGSECRENCISNTQDCFLKLRPKQNGYGHQRFDQKLQKWVKDKSAYYQLGGANPGFHGAHFGWPDVSANQLEPSLPTNLPNGYIGFNDLSKLPGRFRRFFKWNSDGKVNSISIMGSCKWTFYNEVNFGGHNATHTGSKELSSSQDFGLEKSKIKSIKFHPVEIDQSSNDLVEKYFP